MLYYTVVLTRRADVSQDEFERHWLGDHLALAHTLPGIVSAQFFPLAEGQQAQVMFGGFGVLCFPDQRTLETAVASAAGRALREHTGVFADSVQTHRLVTRDPVGFVAEV